NERLLQLHNGVLNVPLPGFLPEPCLARFAKVVLNDAAIAIRQVAQLKRQDIILPNQRGSKSCSESEKKHSTTVVAAERLHGCVIDNAHGFAQRLLKVEPHPASSEMLWLTNNFAVTYGGRKPQRDGVKLPVGDQRFDLVHHRTRRQLPSGFEFSPLRTRDHQLHI